MAVIDIAVEIGTSYTSIFLSGNGIVLREPTIIAFIGDPKQKRVRAIGVQAEEMLGKAPERTTIVTPVVDGFITDPEVCGILLREFVRKILPDNFIFTPKIRAILGVPMGLTVEECAVYEEVCAAAGIGDVTMVENIILSGVGLDLPIDTGSGSIMVNIGGGTTEIAALSLAGVISGCGVSIGGNMMDKALIDHLAGKYDIKVGYNTIRKVKNAIGSLCENDISKMTVMGRNVKTKSVGSAEVLATDICTVLKPYYTRIADAVESIINMCPPEVVGQINKTGIYLVGGGSQILGVDKLFSQRLGIDVNLVEEPSYAAILGAGKLLGDRKLLSDILIQK